MRNILIIVLGICFGIVLAKGEVISWFRIYEMFRFKAFHMYGVIGSAVVIGALGIRWIKTRKLNDVYGESIEIAAKEKSFLRYIIGGTIFGIGWGLVGACPGPMFILLGYGYVSLLIVILGALAGTFVYGSIRKYLPH